MKHRFIISMIALMIVLMVTAQSLAVERKSLTEVSIDAFTADTQATPQGAGDNHIAIAWWIPNEFWKAVLTRDESISESEKKETFKAMSGVSLLAIVQADITTFGAFNFYSKEEIEKKIKISYTDADGKKQGLPVMQSINPDLEILLGAFKPILGAAMGNLGNNMHFYVLDDKSKSSARLLDPYIKGQIDVQLSRKDNASMNATIAMPLNSLFVPRKCPNGKDAHISWKYCPWTGKALED